MNYLIQELTNVVNFIDNDNGHILFSAGKLGTAKGYYVDFKYIEIYDVSGEISGILRYDNATSIQVQDLGGGVVAWIGTFEDLLNKLNDEYFDNTTTAGAASLPVGAATEAKQDTQITEAQSANTKLDSLLTELQLKADLSETQPISAASLPLPTGAATETTLVSVDANLTGVQRTPTLIRATDATGSPIAAGAVEVSVYNAGNADGVLLGATIKKGETIVLKVNNQKDTLGAISYDGTGTELVILTLV